MFVGKAKAYQGGAPFGHSTHKLAPGFIGKH
jgi:hypothetical protein